MSTSATSIRRNSQPSARSEEMDKASRLGAPQPTLASRRRPSQISATSNALSPSEGLRQIREEPGESLPDRIRQTVEPHLGADLGPVRIHRGAAADRSARQLGARAYTAGAHIAFREGEFKPESEQGMSVLIHELTHVVQQHLGQVPSVPGPDGIAVSQPRDPAEQAAHHRAGEIGRAIRGDMALASAAPSRGQRRGGSPPPAGQISPLTARSGPVVVQRFDSFEHVYLGDTAAGGPSGGFIILDAHRRDLPNHATPTTGWPPEWVRLWPTGTPDQQRAIRDGLTYGEVVALAGDLYASIQPNGATNIAGSVAALNKASLREIWDLIPLIHSHNATTGQFEVATGGRYMALAKLNLSHFSNVPGGRSNMDVWRDGHAQAIRAARDGNADLAWITNAASDHFLTDAFAAGHMREPRAALMGSTSGQIEAKVVHDLDNSHGVEVTNARGNHWTAYGDDHLSPDPGDPAPVAMDKLQNRAFALEAVAASKGDITDALAQRAAYPNPPSPVPAGTFRAEAIVPHPVSLTAQRWGARDRAGEMAHLAASELPEQLTPNDTRIREWAARQPGPALEAMPLDEKLRMINRLLDGWVSTEDLDGIDRLCTFSTNAHMAVIEPAITPRVGSLISPWQRRRLRAILARRR